MALVDTMVSNGLRLFKYRGQIPVLIFLLAVPVLFTTNQSLYSYLNDNQLPLVAFTLISVILVAAGMALRAYTVCTTPKGTSGRNTDRQVADVLNTKGIYSVVRHPLYLANYLIWAGLLVYTMNAFAFVIVSLVYWIYYERIMLAEESFLRTKFGNQFEEWARQVPAFVPKMSIFKPGTMRFSWKTFIRREYATLMSVVVTYTVIDYILFYLISAHSYSDLLIVRPSMIVAIVYAVMAVSIKIVKHKTNWLEATPDRD